MRYIARVLIASAAALMMLAPLSAAADDFGYPNPGFVADGADHWYCYGNVSNSGERADIANSMSFLDDSTDMYDVYAGSTCGTSTDVVWVTGDLPSGTRGQTTCVKWAFWGVCDQYWVTYDIPEIFTQTVACGGDGANYTINWFKTIRHELGHTAGLSHTPPPALCAPSPGAVDAMTSGWVTTNFIWVVYSQHHIDHINAQY